MEAIKKWLTGEYDGHGGVDRAGLWLNREKKRLELYGWDGVMLGCVTLHNILWNGNPDAALTRWLGGYEYLVR